jgi:hypothetical protein
MFILDKVSPTSIQGKILRVIVFTLALQSKIAIY